MLTSLGDYFILLSSFNITVLLRLLLKTFMTMDKKSIEYKKVIEYCKMTATKCQLQKQ